MSDEEPQIPQNDFEICIKNAESWMQNIHKRLKINDNTEGPRPALESRLRETEKICSLEPEGKILVDRVMMAAEKLLSESSDDEKHEIHIRLGKIKCLYEETTTYMTHCHSRIEWVWLHWNEYLKAREEFTVWVHNMTLTLEPNMELQLGLKEKCWQYEQSQVLLKDINNQSQLLDRLLEESASLYNRIGDPSVDETERTRHLENIMKEHEAYERDVNDFQMWLNGVIEKLKCFVGGDTESTENRLNMLQEINKEVQAGVKKLEDLEVKSEEVIKNTSPLGAENISLELEELRRALEELKHMNDEEEKSLLKAHSSESAFLLLATQLKTNINEFRKAIQRLEESLESGERVKSEDELVALWKTLNATKSALAAEEMKGERVQVQLKDLFRFSKDVQPLSDGVISAMREYQRARNKAFKLSTETESALIQNFYNPLREFQHWKCITERVLDTTSAPLSNESLNHDCLLQIERLLEESTSIKNKLDVLHAKKERINSVVGEQKAEVFFTEVTSAVKEMENLCVVLQERKKKILSINSQNEKFDGAFHQLQKKISTIRIKAAKESELQPDLVGKETQLHRFQMFQEDLLKLETEFKELTSMAELCPTHQLKVGQLSSEHLTLHRSLEINIHKSKNYIKDHRIFNDKLLDLKRWLMVIRQALESFQDSNGQWDVESQEREIQKLLAEVTEKEIHLDQVESQGLLVMESSSPEGTAHIQTELRQLNDSWASLKLLWEDLARTLNDKELQRLALSPPKSTTLSLFNQQTGLELETDAERIQSPPDTGTSGYSVNTDSEGIGPKGILSRIVYDTSPLSASGKSDKSRIPVRSNQTASFSEEKDPSYPSAEPQKSTNIYDCNTRETSLTNPTIKSDQSRIPVKKPKETAGYIAKLCVF
ncbi:hypothetical protein GDO86_015970 [Hymenochirus boettgeri]|uniref:Nesprin-1/3 spectrin repeats region domain-containing protein n=1 Tax=Hymenochirus boettgeri TaxID=247094 RepID=A0A8T2JV48_9PIPI|nr:hypothetical protein GDO86_015970 [Hymenochirus boettgeri]